MSRSSPAVVQKKTLPIKRNDGEPLTRVDLQYDLLKCIFSDSRKVFTDPNPTIHGAPPGTKVTFRDLYVNYLVRSLRASKVLKDKMSEVPEFGTDFAMLALLANVGRINTTMAFFPEMKTAIRTYHPVPSLQNTDGNLQDAPRIKSVLKACTMDIEGKGGGIPSTPVDILARSRSGQIPSTTVTNLIFVMAHHAVPLAQMHFDNAIDFLDFFMPTNISSPSRARAFLWLCYHYLESPSPDGNGDALNPFADNYSSVHPGKIPQLEMLSPEDMKKENVDSEAEVMWGERMTVRRKEFQAKEELRQAKGSKGKSKKTEDDNAAGPSNKDAPIDEDGDSKTEISFEAKNKISLAKQKKASAEKARRARQKEAQKQTENNTPAPSLDERGSLPPNFLQAQRTLGHEIAHSQQSNLYLHSHERTNCDLDMRRARTPDRPSLRYSPYKLTPVNLPKSRGHSKHYSSHRRPGPRMRDSSCAHHSMFQHALHVISTTDPLLDSDEELGDETVRCDYNCRLAIMSRLRGKDPTPPPETQAHSQYLVVDFETADKTAVQPVA